MLGGAGSPGGDELLTVTVVRDDQGYGMKVSGDNPVYVQSVKEHGAAWRAGLRAGDRILRVDGVPVHHHTHQQVVMMIRANATAVLTVHQNTSRHKTPITAPLPVNPEKQRQLEVSKVHTMRLMLEQEQKYIRELRNELSKVPDVRKQAQLESSEQRCATLQHEIDTITAGQPPVDPSPATPRLARTKTNLEKPAGSPPPTSFLSGLPRSLSNLTGQSLRNLRTRQNNKGQQENQPPLVRQNSDETNKRRHVHNNTVPMVPTTCLDNTPPPLPPRSIERPKRNPLSPNMTPVNPLAKPKPSSSSPAHKYYKRDRGSPMHQSMPSYESQKMRMSSHSLDGELDGPQPNSIALQMSYPLVNVPPPPLQTDDRTGVPILHVRSQSSPEHLDHGLPRSGGWPGPRGTPPPGTPPPPYAHNTQPCADPQRAIISMEEDDSPACETSNPGLFSNLRTVLDSKARTAVLLNWLLGERRCACATLLLLITDGYRSAAGVSVPTLRRWAYEIQSTFLAPAAVLRPPTLDPQAVKEVEDALHDDYDKEEILRNVFRKARQKAKEEMAQQLNEFQVKRQVGLGGLYGPDDAQIERCVVDKAQEQVIVERLLVQCLSGVANAGTGSAGAAAGGCGARAEGRAALLAALQAAALYLQCRPATVAAAAGGARAGFLQRDKLYKQRLKQLSKMNPQPFIVRGHHLQLQALTSEAHCHYCDEVIWGLAPQAYFCTDCKLRVHRNCAKSVEEACCIVGDHNNRISRLIDLIHPAHQPQDDKKSKKATSTTHFLNMERSTRKLEDEQQWEHAPSPLSQERRDESDESLYESADCHSDAISASDDAIPRLSKSPTMSKESLKLAITDEEVDIAKNKKGHRKTMSLSNPLEIVKNLGDDWFDHKKDLDKHSDKKKSRESLWSEEEKDLVHGSTTKLELRKNSKKEDKSNSSSRKSSTTDAPKSRKSSKGSSVGSFFLRRKKTPTTVKPVEAVAEAIDKIVSTTEILNYTRTFLEEEKRHASITLQDSKPAEDTDTDDELPTPKVIGEHRRRLSRQTSRSKSKVRGKSQSLKVNTLRKSHSGTLKKSKKKSIKTPQAVRSRQASVVESTPIVTKKFDANTNKHNSWLFSAHRGESKREGSSEEPTAPEPEADAAEAVGKEPPTKDTNWRAAASGGRGVNRAESCRERDPPRRGKHRNASDPNRLTAHNNHDLEGGAATAPSGSSSSSSLSSRSNESTTVPADQQASQSDWSEEEDPLAPQWADSLPPQILDSLLLDKRHRKRQEVIHELIVSEGSHVRWLKVLGVDFLRPLEKQPALLPADELRALFPNLPGVRERHVKLYSDLRALRNDSTNHIVPIRAVADAMLGTLGDSGYASCLSRFCRNQRLALETLRERRRKNKELHHFLSAREQLPRCGRLQLRDLLACVWQRLTKYQLLLEGILKTVCESDADSDEDIAQLKRAHDTAKDVLQSVDTAIRTAENDHRLRTIQNKLEVRAGSDWDELRRLDLTQKQLRMEGELSVRHDGNKKISVLALMLTDVLVLLQREGDKFVLRPMSAPSQQAPLSPLVKWDKVLFRPNAAARNTFFLMNINGVQMHELSANTPAEYATWVKNIQECPLAKLAEQKPNLTPQHQHSASRTTDDEAGSNVSRNPSDASEKSSAAEERERASLEREREAAAAEREKEPEKKEEKEKEGKDELVDREEKHVPRRPTMSRISTHSSPPPLALEPQAAVVVSAPRAELAHTATRAFTPQEQLRRLDEVINKSLRAKSAVVAELLGVPADSYAQVADLAVAEALEQCDTSGELRLQRSVSNEEPSEIHTLLLAALTQANQLTESLTRALTVNEAAAVAARARARGRCERCTRRPLQRSSTLRNSQAPEMSPPRSPGRPEELSESTSMLDTISSLEKEVSFDMLSDLEQEPNAEHALESNASSASLAASLVPLHSGLQRTLARLLGALPALESARRDLRREIPALRDANDALRHANPHYQLTEEMSYPANNLDQSLQDQPSNGG